MKIDDYTNYNQKFYDEFKDWRPEQLLSELEKWIENLNEEIEKVGRNNLEKRRKEFDWVLDDGDDSHFLHHLKKFKKQLKINKIIHYTIYRVV